MTTCRFVSSWGGVRRCLDPADQLGFCHFHHDCYLRGELDNRGVISERLTDQDRRRAINFHGVRSEDVPVA